MVNQPIPVMEEQTETPNDVPTRKNVTTRSLIYDGFGPRSMTQ
jgi:hypothetical protein